jgi:hypothetical protein
MRVSDLIAKADGFKEDAYNLIEPIIRVKSDLTKEIVNVNLEMTLEEEFRSRYCLKRMSCCLFYLGLCRRV